MGKRPTAISMTDRPRDQMSDCTEYLQARCGLGRAAHFAP
jgi:hypothetical protein